MDYQSPYMVFAYLDKNFKTHITIAFQIFSEFYIVNYGNHFEKSYIQALSVNIN